MRIATCTMGQGRQERASLRLTVSLEVKAVHIACEEDQDDFSNR